MSRLTLIGGSTQRFVLEDGTEGYLEVKKDPTDKQVEKGTPIGVVFVPDPSGEDLTQAERERGPGAVE